MRTFLSPILSLIAYSISCAADPTVDVGTLSVIVPETRDEFVATNPLDVASVERGWQYALRYVHHEPETELSFGLLMVKGSGTDQFRLALHNGDDRKFTFREFDEMEQEQKLQVASATKSVDVEFAQVLYGAWVRALLRACHGDAGTAVIEGQYYYLSSFSLETGYMCATASNCRKGTTPGRIAEIGKLLRRYVQERDESRSKELERKIRSLCTGIATSR